MNFIIYSDIQGIELELPNIEPDFVLLLGDIEWRDVKRIDNHFKCPKLGVLGNHDRIDTFGNTSIIDMHEKVLEIYGIKFAGFGGSPVYNHKPGSPQYDEGDAASFVKKVDNVDIFLAHSNPAFEHNMDKTDAHRGFASFTELIERTKTPYFLHGHLHENTIFDYLETTIIITHGMRNIRLT
jgi:Icc-related predicted phosphoesterase